MSIPARITSTEERRLAALAEYEILDSSGEDQFDAFTRLAARLCDAPIALISLVERDRERIISAYGVTVRDVPRDVSFGAVLIAHGGVLVVEDTAADRRFAGNPLLGGGDPVRFYAGVALRSRGGDTVGALAVLDRRPRVLDDERRAALTAIAETVVDEFESHRTLARAQQRINLLSAAIEAAQDPIILSKPGPTADDSPTIVYANEAFIQMKGAARAEDVIGHRAEEFHGPKTDRAQLRALRAEVMAGRPARAEYISYRIDGTHYHTEATARPLVDERGRTTHYVMVQRDVTEQVLRGVQLTMQNERLTAITSIARGLFASLEPSMLVEALLSGVHELLEGRATLYAPRPRGGFVATVDLSTREDGAPADAFVALAARSDVCVLDELEQRAAVRVPGSGGGAAYVLDVQRGSAFHTADVFALGLLGQYFAVAARNVELYQELTARRDAVVELNQVKNDLIAMLAHDFKGPLTTIVGFADVLAEDDRFDQEARQYLGMISSSAMRLASLATDTLALSRLEQNELTLAVTDVDLVALVRDVVRVLGVTRPIELRVPGSRLIVAGDADRLRQVVENLIGNAIKYSPGGEPVEVVLRGREGGVELTVRDRGIGIPERDRSKLFGRFARAGNARALGISGTGFGLYLSRTILELHGGTIEVESAEGQGSMFRVFVPVHSPNRSVASRRIALLDVDGDARSYVAQALRDDGFAVTVATSGEDLLRALADAPFDVALVDADRLEMPVDDFLTRTDGMPLVRMGIRLTADVDGWGAFLTKPFLMKDLYGAIDAALDQANVAAPSPSGGPHEG
ncbi:MAG TPA: ATP-binding protein [Candidatus Elarobacter sp.]|nr:ATP-binding protein [Candidatus Elarobacter sp.]